MRKYILLMGIATMFGFSTLALADTMTDDSTNTYTHSDQYNEKLHQKPVADDANSGSDTTKHKRQPAKKHKVIKKKAAGAHPNAI